MTQLMKPQWEVKTISYNYSSFIIKNGDPFVSFGVMGGATQPLDMHK